MPVIHRESCSGTLFRLRTCILGPPKILILTISFLNPDVSCLMIISPKLLGLINVFVVLTLYQVMWGFRGDPHEF